VLGTIILRYVCGIHPNIISTIALQVLVCGTFWYILWNVVRALGSLSLVSLATVFFTMFSANPIVAR